MEYIIEKIENGMALCHEKTSNKELILSINKLPANCVEGDIIIESDGKYTIDKENTIARHEKLAARLDSLVRKNQI